MRDVFKTACKHDWVINPHNPIEGGKRTIDRLAKHRQNITPSRQHGKGFGSPARLEPNCGLCKLAF